MSDDPIRAYSLDECRRSVQQRHLTEQPRDPSCYVEQRYCENRLCDVREVEIKIKPDPDGRMLVQEFLCPCCRKKLKHHGFVFVDERLPEEFVEFFKAHPMGGK